MRRTFPCLFGLALLLPAAARAFDQKDNEGVFENTGSFSLYCYKDINTDTPQWTICYTTLLPGQSCKADAVGSVLGGPVYKIPNHTHFRCSIPTADAGAPMCAAADRSSAVIIDLALVKHWGGYKDLTWARFWALMSGGTQVPLRACGNNWIPLEPLSCPAAAQPGDEALQSIAPTAAVLPLVRQ